MADNIVQEVNSPNILVITDSDQNQITVTQPLTNTIEVATPGPQGVIGSTGPAGPTGSSTPFTKISGSDSWFTTSSIQLTGSLQGTASYAVAAGTYLYLGNSSVTSSISWSQATLQELNLDNDPTLTFAGGAAGTQTNLLLKQTLVGQRSITWPSNVLWNNGSTPSLPILSNVANAGGIDPTFVSGTGFDFSTNTVAVQSDGKVLVGGQFSSYNGTSVPSFVRLNTNGTLDTAFMFNIGTGPNFEVARIAIQLDGKIIVTGPFATWNGNAVGGIVRLNSDGTIDNTFVTGTGLIFNGNTTSLKIQSNGKILISGFFLQYNGTNVPNFVRINSDGSIDSTFVSNLGTGGNSFASVKAIGVQSDGKIIIAGTFTTWNSLPYDGIVRLNSDGTVDGTFNVGTGFSGAYNVSSVVFQTDGKIIIGGEFASYNSTSRNNIVRINTNGGIDNTFSIGTGFNGVVNSVQIQSDDKIVTSGAFTSYNGFLYNRVIRLNSNGGIDNTLTIGTGFNNAVRSSYMTYPNIFFVGLLSSYNGTSQLYISKIGLASVPPATTYTKVSFEYNGTDYIGSI